MHRDCCAPLALCVLASGVLLHAQARSGEWTTVAGDAQRSAWVRSDARLTKDAVRSGELQLLWKMKFENEPKQLNSLTEPMLQDLLIGYRGFKALGFVGGSDDRLFAIDTDLARPYWTTYLTYAVATGGQPPSTWDCPGGLVATPSRRTRLTPQGPPTFGGGRGARAGSAVGEPGRGAAVLSQMRPRSAAPPPRPAPPRDPAAPAATPNSALAPVPFGGVDPLYVMGSDGLLRTLRVSDGAPMSEPIPFLPPTARPSSLIFIDGIIYTTTSHGCGAAPNGVWALDLTADNKVARWHTGAAHVAGAAGPAFGTDGTLFVATTAGARSHAGTSNGSHTDNASRPENGVFALDRASLQVKDWFTAENADFNASPVVFAHGGRQLVAASGGNGQIYLLDAASLGGTDHRTPLHATSYSTPHRAGGLATWEDQGTRWIVAAAAGDLAAFKVVEQSGRLTFAPAWRSRALVSPLPPVVVNGMVFAASSGEFRGGVPTLTATERRQRSTPAVLYALDAATGAPMWTSGTSITSFARAGIAAGFGQIYVVTYDNHLYAFGIPMEH